MTAAAILPSVPRGEHVPKLIRFPPRVAERIEALARQGYRPFTSQVMLMLEQWLEEHAPESGKKGG